MHLSIIVMALHAPQLLHLDLSITTIPLSSCNLIRTRQDASCRSDYTMGEKYVSSTPGQCLSIMNFPLIFSIAA